jgi:hypothetical protein
MKSNIDMNIGHGHRHGLGHGGRHGQGKEHGYGSRHEYGRLQLALSVEWT